MKISVITVCRNAEDVIENTLLSVFNQTYKDIEYIVIDGASTDNTPGVLERCKDQLSCLISEPDSGIYNAMNKGIKRSTGDFLYFLNAGDSLHDENVFADVIEEFRQFPEAELIFGDLYFVSNGKSQENCLYKPDRIAKSSNFLFNLSLYTGTLPHQGSFFKKSLFDRYGLYREDLKMKSDYEFYLRILIKHRVLIKYTDRIIANYSIEGITGLKANIEAGLEEKKLARKDYPILNKANFRNYEFVVKILYPFVLKNFKPLIRKYNKNRELKESVNRFIARFIGGHLNVIYDEVNSIAPRV